MERTQIPLIKGTKDKALELLISSNDDYQKVLEQCSRFEVQPEKVFPDGNSFFAAILYQLRHPTTFNAVQLRRLTALIGAKFPERFIDITRAVREDGKESYESLLRNILAGYIPGHPAFAAFLTYFWHIKITLLSPAHEPMKLFHNSDNPDVIIIHNGNLFSGGHFSATCKSNNLDFLKIFHNVLQYITLHRTILLYITL